MAQAKRLAATGDVTTRGAILRGVTLTPAAAASSVAVREGGSGGTLLFTLAAVANGASVVLPGLDVWCADGIHVTLTGASAEACVLFD